MRAGTCAGFAAAVLGVCVTCRSAAPDVAPLPRAIARGVWLIPGGIQPNREPDGNTVLFEAPAGIIVMDTGRHEWQRQAILSFADDHHRKVVAVINSHWHLDHVSGNPALRAAFPNLRVYSSDAIDNALRGFLAANTRESAQYLNDPQVPEELRQDIRADAETVRNGAALRPDVVIRESGPLAVGGRTLQIHLAPFAATRGDVWVYEKHSGVAALGDLVTLPAPFLDTACPEGWKNALAAVVETPFKVAIPGHGLSLTHAQVDIYRHAFDAFIDCSNSDQPARECASHWEGAVHPLLGPDPLEPRRAREMAEYYVNLLRANGGRSAYCESAGGATTGG